MKIVILLIPLAILLVAGAIAAFIWALRRNQFDDLDSPAWRVIFDDRERREDDHD
jgi:cbb3-type cytochrome oxidase maturation protein